MAKKTMTTQGQNLARRAAKYWDDRDLSKLVALPDSQRNIVSPEAWYFVGLANHALNERRKAVACWRKAIELEPTYDAPLRALAFEFIDQDAVEAADLIYQLIGLKKANADDLTALAEIRIKQDRLGEAQRLVQRALEMEGDNSLALLAMVSIYARVRDRGLALSYLKKANDTGDVDLSDLESDAEFEFLWNDKEFAQLVAGN